MAESSILKFQGSNYLRQRLVLSTLSGCETTISNIRDDTDEPGLTEYEAGLIRLLDKMTNGSTIHINETATKLYYNPGILEGGKVSHDCSLQRSIGYYLEPIIMLAPFAKEPFEVTLTGITNGTDDPSVDHYRMCTVPLLKKFIPSQIQLKINKRGFPPSGGGEIYFSCSVMRKMKPLQLTDPGKVKKIRGILCAQSIPKAYLNRITSSCRASLNPVLPDVYIFLDSSRAKDELSKGYSLLLASESTTGVTHAVDVSLASLAMGEDVLPEEFGSRAVQLLFEEILKGGCADSVDQPICLLFMALGDKDVSKIQLGNLTEYTREFLRNIKAFFGQVYKIESKRVEVGDLEHIENTLSCLGVGYCNYSKGMK